MLVRSINPATLQTNKTFQTVTTAQALLEAKECKDAFLYWRALDIDDRAKHMGKLATTLRKKKEGYARTMTIEMGKPIKQALDEAEKCAWAAEVYADNAETWLEEEIVKADGKRHVVTFEPLGVVLSVMPWNLPFWQAMRFGIPALIAGNVALLRHSNTVPMCSLAIEEVFREAGFPKGVFKSVITDYQTVQALIESPEIAAASLTGSTSAGARVAMIAGANLKKCVLELGGSDPFIVLEDADLRLACKGAADGRTVNSGQSCIAAKRFIVVEEVAEEFTQRFVESVQALKIGDPLDLATDVGPLANKEQLSKLEAQVKDAVHKGAKALTGGKRFNGSTIGKEFKHGYFYEPTVLSHTGKQMRVVNEEVFGPVAPIIVVKNEEEAIRAANASQFGLGASVWTKDLKRGEEVARRLEAGCVFVNNIVKSDPRMPFGGVKRSGIGRELSHYGLKEFMNVKGINVYQP